MYRATYPPIRVITAAQQAWNPRITSRRSSGIDGILGKGSRVLGEPDPIKPGFYLVIVAHCRMLSPPTKSIVTFPFKFAPHIALLAPRAAMKRPRRRAA
jgi:hypothetical protein